MFYIIDRRKNQKGKSDTNQYRFFTRYRRAIQQAIRSAINTRNIADVTKTGVTVRVPSNELTEYRFIHNFNTGIRHSVNPGNTKFREGDLVRKPPSDAGAPGRGGSADGSGEDDFVFDVSRDQLREILVDDLELPNLVKTSLAEIKQWKTQRAGYSTNGLPCQLDLIRSVRRSMGREFALSDDDSSDVIWVKINELRDSIQRLLQQQLNEQQLQLLAEKRLELQQLEASIVDVQTTGNMDMDKMDLQYRQHTKIPVPNTKAVVFCLMDVSASMGQHEKDLAKRFFLLLYLFLEAHYSEIQIRFIRHHSEATEVDENEFFYGRETGGTVVTSVMHKMKEIIDTDYNDGNWNIYAAQASDGDNYPVDEVPLYNVMDNDIMPLLQYFAYIEVFDDNWWRGVNSSISNTYTKLKQKWSNMDLGKARTPGEIFPVFYDMFKRGK